MNHRIIDLIKKTHAGCALPENSNFKIPNSRAMSYDADDLEKRPRAGHTKLIQ